MRRTLIAGNWKMNLNRSEAAALTQEILDGINNSTADVDFLVCPPSVYLESVRNSLGKASTERNIALGAQDVYFEPNGAFTGEISTSMLADLGCQYVILGHSERRHVIGETDALINKKLIAVLKAGLTPILCVGETLSEREAGQTKQVVDTQLSGSLAGLSAEQVQQIVIAYEPVWAIGTGKTATPEQAQDVHADLRKELARRYNLATAEQVRILYGGSVKKENAADLLTQTDIDGALIGGASLKADSFLGIANASSASLC